MIVSTIFWTKEALFGAAGEGSAIPRLTSAGGKLYAHASATCFVLDGP
jgi:acyl-coenzyme A thioesterase PaaI-like protein